MNWKLRRSTKMLQLSITVEMFVKVDVEISVKHNKSRQNVRTLVFGDQFFVLVILLRQKIHLSTLPPLFVALLKPFHSFFKESLTAPDCTLNLRYRRCMFWRVRRFIVISWQDQLRNRQISTKFLIVSSNASLGSSNLHEPLFNLQQITNQKALSEFSKKAINIFLLICIITTH